MISYPFLPAYSHRQAHNPLSIALFTYSTKLRGSVVHTLELAEALHKLGHNVCVYALSKDGKGFDYSLSCRVCLIPTQPAPADTDALIQQRTQEFIEYLTHHPPTYDIYHAQDCLSANALAILRQQHYISHFIRTVHHIEEYTSPYLQECQDRSIRAADLCLCVSDRWQIELWQQYGIQAARVSNGVNLQQFSPIPTGIEPQLKQRWKLTGSPIFLTVGGVEPRKNSINLLDAFAQVRQDFSNAQLVIAGGETLFDYQTYRDDFFAVADRLGIVVGDSLILPGVVPTTELPALYRTADAFVFPSLKEGWGLVLLEAIASGLPIITSNQPPFTEFLTPQQAWLVDPQSSTEIAEAMIRSCQPELTQAFVENSQLILPNYTWKISAQLHLQHYQHLLKTMPEINFKIQWPDGTQEICYSPSLVVKDYFTPNSDYSLNDFLERSRTALQIASDRVQAKYGMPCSMALKQLARIEATAARYPDGSQSKVHFIQFLE